MTVPFPSLFTKSKPTPQALIRSLTLQVRDWLSIKQSSFLPSFVFLPYHITGRMRLHAPSRKNESCFGTSSIASRRAARNSLVSAAKVLGRMLPALQSVVAKEDERRMATTVRMYTYILSLLMKRDQREVNRKLYKSRAPSTCYPSRFAIRQFQQPRTQEGPLFVRHPLRLLTGSCLPRSMYYDATFKGSNRRASKGGNK